jgi:hypothetical protein
MAGLSLTPDELQRLAGGVAAGGERAAAGAALDSSVVLYLPTVWRAPRRLAR